MYRNTLAILSLFLNLPSNRVSLSVHVNSFPLITAVLVPFAFHELRLARDIGIHKLHEMPCVSKRNRWTRF